MKARGVLSDVQAFLKKTGGIPSGPPAVRTFSLLIMRITKVGEKKILEIPGLVVQGGMYGKLWLSEVN
mgnify:CR=1 FL=1